MLRTSVEHAVELMVVFLPRAVQPWRRGTGRRCSVPRHLLRRRKMVMPAGFRLAWWARPRHGDTPPQVVHDAMDLPRRRRWGAFERLLDELWPVVLSLARVRGVAQGADAEDIAREVFLKIWARIADFNRSRDGSAGVRHRELRDPDPPAPARASAGGGRRGHASRGADPAASTKPARAPRALWRRWSRRPARWPTTTGGSWGFSGARSRRSVRHLRKRRQRALNRLRLVGGAHGEP